tara:strand:- start:31710 stop:33158 length:1449 start_codon:yes stop_codon:yes gene_type:complete
MQVGTTPLRWPELRRHPREREERVERTNINFIEQQAGLPTRLTQIPTLLQLHETLQSLATEVTSAGPSGPPCLRLFIVEDLSRGVIEALGSRFDIDALFFREQTEDYIWHNTRDPWVKTPDLHATMKRRKWFRVRNARLRYHKSERSFQDSRLEAAAFNVLRRPDDDANHWRYQDAKGSVVSTTRTKTTIWVGEDRMCANTTVGIVLLDPTTKHGYPLWYDRANWIPLTDMFTSQARPSPSSESWFADITQSTLSYPWFQPSAAGAAIDVRRIVLPAIYTVCAEWLVVCEYVKARLGQVEWMMEMPALFIARGPEVDRALKKLNVWRRQVPAWREMVAETLHQTIPAAKRLTLDPNRAHDDDDAFGDVTADFERVLDMLDRLQARIDRLSDRGNAEMQLEAARQSLAESHDLARLTWLATIFVPLTFMSGLFSMTDDVGSITGTFRVYFAAAVPVAFISLVIARWGSVVFRGVARLLFKKAE